MADSTADGAVNALPPTQAPNGVSNTAVQAADQDHPDGAEIRRQVEFYFSDENLPTDLNLLKCCNGRNNDPVSISMICGWKKMRGYKPKRLVVAALRKSAFLQVTADGKRISRRLALQGKCVMDPDFFENDANDIIAYDPRIRKPAVYPVPLIPQTKQEYPPGMTKNMMKPTGFEDDYVEEPIRPEEAVVEQALYDPEKLFVDRIEIAIERFRSRRRLHERYVMPLSRLMLFGGVEGVTNMFQGTSKEDMADMDAEQIARAKAIYKVDLDRSYEDKWIVDFPGVLKGLLSSWWPAHEGREPDSVKYACQTPRSFYRYLRYHSVCPEYDEQLQEALKICDIAEQEMFKTYTAGLALPGDFNKSGSTIFGGAEAGLYAGDQLWAKDMKEDGIDTEKMGVRDEEARIKFMTGVAIMGTDEQDAKLDTMDFKTVQRLSTGLEVVDIQLPTEATKAAYCQQSEVTEEKLAALEPLGKLICKTWFADDYDEWDLPKDKYPDGKPHRAVDDRTFEFWVEERVLEECFVGMKMDAEVMMLESGITILDEVHTVMCSFYTWLANELLVDRKAELKTVRWLYKQDPKYDEDDDNAAGEEQGFAGSDEEFEVNGNGQNDQAQGVFDDDFDDE